MTILVTGGNGLVGARLLPRLVEAGLDCRALLRSHAAPSGVVGVQGDLLAPETLRGAVEGVTGIIHLAALFRSADEAAIREVNQQGTRNLIAATLAYAPEARFVMASTALVYGPQAARPSTEEDPAGATQAYPASKLVAEADLRASALNWSILRFPFVYGEGDAHLESVVAHYETFKWHPALRFSMLHHQDLASGVLLALDGAFDRRVINLADDAPTTMYEMSQIAGGSIPPSSEPLADPWAGQVDSSLARSLGFAPSVRTVRQAQDQGLI